MSKPETKGNKETKKPAPEWTRLKTCHSCRTPESATHHLCTLEIELCEVCWALYRTHVLSILQELLSKAKGTMIPRRKDADAHQISP